MNKGLTEDIIFTLKISFGTALLIGIFFYFLFQRPDLMRNFGYEPIKGSASPIIDVSYDNPGGRFLVGKVKKGLPAS